jgi:DNA modification methylase
VWKHGKAPHINNIQLGKYGRYTWSYAKLNTFRKGRMEESSAHPTVKPCALVMDAIKDCSKPGGLVLDPFGGSGTTLIAAHKTRRRARLLEVEAAYIDLTIRRWQVLTGGQAHHAAADETFADVAHRCSQAAPRPDGAEEDGHGEA